MAALGILGQALYSAGVNWHDGEGDFVNEQKCGVVFLRPHFVFASLLNRKTELYIIVLVAVLIREGKKACRGHKIRWKWTQAV